MDLNYYLLLFIYLFKKNVVVAKWTNILNIWIKTQNLIVMFTHDYLFRYKQRQTYIVQFQ